MARSYEYESPARGLSAITRIAPNPYNGEASSVPELDLLEPVEYVPMMPPILPPRKDNLYAVSESNGGEELEETLASLMQNPVYAEAMAYGEDAEQATEQVVNGLKALYAHHQESFWHTLGVVENAAAIAQAVGLSTEKRALLVRAAFRHDEGKTSVPEYVLSMPKTQKFTPVEFQVLKDHSIQSYSIMVSQGDTETATVAIGHHQMQGERSYPEDPPLDESYEHYDLQVYLTLADVKDAMSKKRSYKDAMEDDVVREKLSLEFGDRILQLHGGRKDAAGMKDRIIGALMGDEIDEPEAMNYSVPMIPIYERAITA